MYMNLVLKTLPLRGHTPLLWLLMLSCLLVPTTWGEEEKKLDPSRLYMVVVSLGDGADKETLDAMSDYFTDTYPMDTICLPDDYMNHEKKTITMFGPSLSQIVDFIEGSCAFRKVQITSLKAGLLTKESGEKIIKKMKRDE